ncbi:hypothetical protein HNQ36_001944 [Afipia massiliensis]|uniref:Uncharacterized protein n=1 Tax=Afipia massiliensis TaxID=211460 RepID=A0A840MYZ3_9BRAD|nr:hypothetical protein [Afipia massiliensis]MBB5051970.1 hypothetical protein [Afipia massiliensis]
MLLTLLRTETRLKYEQTQTEFPVPKDRRRFISCAVNLAHSNSTDFGYRDWHDDDPMEVEMLFGDFVNALLASDLLRSIQLYVEQGSKQLLEEVGVLQPTSHALDEFAQVVANRGIWNGGLSGARTWNELQQRLQARVREYRSFLHRRTRAIPTNILETKTSIGEPVGELADLLREQHVLAPETNVFVDIDQYEELGNIRTGPRVSRPVDYRSVINRAIARRDPRVSYRIGSRRHSWRSHNRIFGSEGRLEEERDYKFVDLDILLKRGENRKTYIFPAFADDVFQRRMKVSGIASDGETIEVERIYGKSETPDQKGKLYNKSVERSYPSDWRESTKKRLATLAANHPLSARLGEAWIRQKGDRDDLEVRDSNLPWEKQFYWRKERIDLALLQLASANQQRPIYSGAEEIFDLSNGNILVFISINQHIWDQYLRFAANRSDVDHGIPKIGRDLQSVGIFKASEHWYMKIAEETGKSAERLRFISEVARVLRERVMSDRKMTYPGASGFSLKESELDAFPKVRAFLEELSDYSNLIMLPHTTKDKDRAFRFKWYFSPILCPYLRLPYKRIKEPYYATIKELAFWLESAGVSSVFSQPNKPTQQSLL